MPTVMLSKPLFGIVRRVFVFVCTEHTQKGHRDRESCCHPFTDSPFIFCPQMRGWNDYPWSRLLPPVFFADLEPSTAADTTLATILFDITLSDR